MTKPFTYDVFLSFTAADEPLAQSLFHRFTASGLRVFFSNAVMKQQAGSRWFDIIESSLEQSRHLLVICSRDSLASKWVRREYTAFLEHCFKPPKRRLVPLRTAGVALADLPIFLRELESPQVGSRAVVEDIVAAFSNATQARMPLRRRAAPPAIEMPVSADMRSTRFSDITALYNYVSGRIVRAKQSVADITWGTHSHYRRQLDQETYDKYVRAMRRAARKKSVSYREISNFAQPQYVERSRALFECAGYNVRYVDTRSLKIPILSFVIIDEKEVVFAFYREPARESDGEIYLSVQSRDVVELFQDYFETLWTSGLPIKEGENVHEHRLDEVASQLSKGRRRAAVTTRRR